MSERDDPFQSIGANNEAPSVAWPSVVVLVGPTAVGKSALALKLADEWNADIVTADSRQVYRYMDIGTAKPTRVEQAQARHYMIDLVAPDDIYSAQRYAAEGRHVLSLVAAAGRIALVVGGTGFYIRALLDGLTLPPVAPDPELRRAIYQEIERDGEIAVHGRLAALDPASAARIHPHNRPRLVRAIEIVTRLGGPVPVPTEKERVDALFLGLRLDRNRLRDRVNGRVVDQVRAGLVEETRQLLAMGYDPSLPALDGFGYREMVRYLEGRLTLDDAIGQYQESTRRFVRRQLTWFRADRRICWLDADEHPANQARPLIQEWLDAHSTHRGSSD